MGESISQISFCKRPRNRSGKVTSVQLDVELLRLLFVHFRQADREDAVLERDVRAVGIDLLREDDGAGETAPVAFLIEIILIAHFFFAAARAADRDGIGGHLDVDVFRPDARDRRFDDDVARGLIDVDGELAFRLASSQVGDRIFRFDDLRFRGFRFRGSRVAASVDARASSTSYSPSASDFVPASSSKNFSSEASIVFK